MKMSSSSSAATTNSSLSSFSDDYEVTIPEQALTPTSAPIPSTKTTSNSANGKKPVHKVEPMFNADISQIRVFLEDGSMTEYPIGENTLAEELVEEMARRHSLGSDMRRYRLTLNEAENISWRAIRYIRPQQRLKEIAEWPSTMPSTLCTLRVVIVPYQVELLADTEPITFTYLYRQSINDYVRERAGSEISIDLAVKLTALLIRDESLCTGVRATTLVKRSWLLRQLFPRSLLDQLSVKQLIHRLRTHLQAENNDNQLIVAKEFLRLFSENTRSFAGKLFPVKFPDKHRDSILLLGPRYPVALLDQARRLQSPIIPLVSSWSHLARVMIKQYRNGVAIRLFTIPRTGSSSTDHSDLLQQEISFLIHNNLLNDLIAVIEGYSQLESSNQPLSIERHFHSQVQKSSNSATATPEHQERSPFVQRLLNTTKNHRTYRIIHEKPSNSTSSPSLFSLTRQFLTRNATKMADIDERETISNVPNRTSLVTWRSLVDSQSDVSPPPPVLYRTVINVQSTADEQQQQQQDQEHPQHITSMSEDSVEPDIIDLTNSNGYYGSLSFPLRPPSPFADGLLWSDQMAYRNQDQSMYMGPSGTRTFLSIHCNVNNNNNNHDDEEDDEEGEAHGSRSASPRRFWNRWLKRPMSKKSSPKEETISMPYYFGQGDVSAPSRRTGKRVHWIDDDQTILDLCYQFVDHLKLFVQHVIHDYYDDEHWRQCQIYLNELHRLTDCSELQRAFDESLVWANEGDKVRLLQQQTFIAQLISRTVLSA